jgi:hypothetical protein
MNESPEVIDYRSAIATIILCGQMLNQFDLAKLIDAINRAESTGPILNPTLWIQKSQAMAQDKQLIEAALPLWKLIKDLTK